MKTMTSKIVKRALSLMLSLVMTASLASALPAVSAEEADCYPYALFALSENDGAITVNAQSFNVNGDIATNGSLYTGGNINLNGMKTENVGESMPFFIDKIEEAYFSGEYEFCDTDYFLSNSNINLSTPIKVQGSSTLEGSINISSALMAQNNIYIEGNTINGNNGVLCAQYGNVGIDCQNVNFSGLIYAPMGTVEITAENISLNSVVVIANEIVLDANNVNVGYSSWAGQLVGTEFAQIPDEETDYEKDTDEDGIPDFIEEEFGTDIKSSDTDSDGMPDDFEVSGMVSQNGTTHYSDPDNPDTDGDGLLDGYEISYEIDKAVHYNYGLKQDETTYNSVSFTMHSDPSEKDSDGDGLDDSFDVKCTNRINNGVIVKALSLDRIYNAYMLHIEDDVSPLHDIYISMGMDAKMSWSEFVEFYNKKYSYDFSISYAQETELMISTIQRCLEYLGFLDMGGAGYGTMGGATKAAIQNFQINYGLMPAKEICKNSYYFIEIDHITYLTIINVATNYGYAINGIDSKKENYEILSNLTAYGYSKVYFTSIPSTSPELTETQIRNGISIYVDNNDGKFDSIYYYDYTKPLDTIIDSLCRESLKYTSAPRTVRYGYFFSKVNHNEEWDVKRREQWVKTIATIDYYSQRFKFCYNSYIMNSEDLGNFIFGCTGHCLEFTQAELNLGSIFAGSTGNSPDDEKDKYYIQLGYTYYNKIIN